MVADVSVGRSDRNLRSAAPGIWRWFPIGRLSCALTIGLLAAITTVASPTSVAAGAPCGEMLARATDGQSGGVGSGVACAPDDIAAGGAAVAEEDAGAALTVAFDTAAVAAPSSMYDHRPHFARPPPAGSESSVNGDSLNLADRAADGGRVRRAPSGLEADRVAPNTARAAVGAADDVPLHSPNFVVHPNGEVVPVPTGAIGPTPARTGSGFQFTGGRGGHGLDPRVTDIRIMDPVVGGKYPLPNGYVSYANARGQTVNPWTGRTIAPADPWWHWGWSSP